MKGCEVSGQSQSVNIEDTRVGSYDSTNGISTNDNLTNDNSTNDGPAQNASTNDDSTTSAATNDDTVMSHAPACPPAGPKREHATSGEAIGIDSETAVLIVKDFVLLKSFDIISSGQYRKFVLRKKDLCEQWAMTMHDNYHAMMTEVRNLNKYIVLARSQGHTEVATVCMKLMHCLECPFNETTGWNTCSITKVHCLGGVRVNAASESVPLVVHGRFLRFCLCFWYAARFEHVLRRIIRSKYTKVLCDEHTLAQISAMIHADHIMIEGVVQNFIHSLKHVHTTMYALLNIQPRASETLSSFAI